MNIIDHKSKTSLLSKFSDFFNMKSNHYILLQPVIFVQIAWLIANNDLRNYHVLTNILEIAIVPITIIGTSLFTFFNLKKYRAFFERKKGYKVALMILLALPIASSFWMAWELIATWNCHRFMCTLILAIIPFAIIFGTSLFLLYNLFLFLKQKKFKNN